MSHDSFVSYSAGCPTLLSCTMVPLCFVGVKFVYRLGRSFKLCGERVISEIMYLQSCHCDLEKISVTKGVGCCTCW